VNERVLTFIPAYWAPDQSEKAVSRTDVSALSFASVVPLEDVPPEYTIEFEGFKLQETLGDAHVALWTSLEVTGTS
jgi:hypothetical protein